MKQLLNLLIGIIFCFAAHAQSVTIVDTASADVIIKKCEHTFPKFYREFEYIKTHDQLIKRIVFIQTSGQDNGPAFAFPNGAIRINIKYLQQEQPGFDDNRLIVVLYHEIGHLHYFMTTPADQRNSENNEKAAFEYSLLKTKELAEKGDCLPLKTELKFMKLRSESDDLQDPHVRALKRMVNEPLYFEYLKYIKANCRG